MQREHSSQLLIYYRQIDCLKMLQNVSIASDSFDAVARSCTFFPNYSLNEIVPMAESNETKYSRKMRPQCCHPHQL